MSHVPRLTLTNAVPARAWMALRATMQARQIGIAVALVVRVVELEDLDDGMPYIRRARCSTRRGWTSRDPARRPEAAVAVEQELVLDFETRLALGGRAEEVVLERVEPAGVGRRRHRLHQSAEEFRALVGAVLERQARAGAALRSQSRDRPPSRCSDSARNAGLAGRRGLQVELAALVDDLPALHAAQEHEVGGLAEQTGEKRFGEDDVAGAGLEVHVGRVPRTGLHVKSVEVTGRSLEVHEVTGARVPWHRRGRPRLRRRPAAAMTRRGHPGRSLRPAIAGGQAFPIGSLIACDSPCGSVVEQEIQFIEQRPLHVHKPVFARRAGGAVPLHALQAEPAPPARRAKTRLWTCSGRCSINWISCSTTDPQGESHAIATRLERPDSPAMAGRSDRPGCPLLIAAAGRRRSRGRPRPGPRDRARRHPREPPGSAQSPRHF